MVLHVAHDYVLLVTVHSLPIVVQLHRCGLLSLGSSVAGVAVARVRLLFGRGHHYF